MNECKKCGAELQFPDYRCDACKKKRDNSRIAKLRRFLPKTLPHLNLIVDFGWFGARTSLWRANFCEFTFEYVVLMVFVGKKEFVFQLYRPRI